MNVGILEFTSHYRQLVQKIFCFPQGLTILIILQSLSQLTEVDYKTERKLSLFQMKREVMNICIYVISHNDNLLPPQNAGHFNLTLRVFFILFCFAFIFLS